MDKTYTLKELEEKATVIREDIIRMLEHAGSGHSAYCRNLRAKKLTDE